MKKIDEALDAVRANPVRFAAWALLLLALVVVAYMVGSSLGLELYEFTH